MNLYHRNTKKLVKDGDYVSMVAHCQKRARLKAIVFREHKFDGQFFKTPSENYPNGLVRLFVVNDNSNEYVTWSNPSLW